MARKPVKPPKNPGGPQPGSGRPKKATDEQKAGLDRARSILRDTHEAVALELKVQLSANKTIVLGGDGGTIEVPDYGTRQGAIDRITKLSGFVADPDDTPLTLGSLFLDLLSKPAGL